MSWRGERWVPWYSSRSMSPSGFGADEEALLQGLLDRLLGGGHAPYDLSRRAACLATLAAVRRSFSSSAVPAYCSWTRIQWFATGLRSRMWNHHRGAKFSCSHQKPIANGTLTITW